MAHRASLKRALFVRLGIILGMAGLGIMLSPGSGYGHDVKLGIAGKKLHVLTSKGAAKQKFDFKAKGQPAIGLAHDPSTENFYLYVGSSDPNGGHTGLIQLNTAMWKFLGKAPDKIKGYKYLDKGGTRAGITKVILKPGQLTIKAKGANWPWSPDGSQSSVRVQFRIEQEWHCAEFGGDVKKNETGRFLATKAESPSSCPEQTCGNRELEVGEECDDGNLDEEDGCTSRCRFATCTSGGEFNTTYEAIQEVIFDSPSYGCNNGLCHGASPGQGLLDLRDANSHGNLVGISSPTFMVKRVEPGEPALSFLYDKLAAGNSGGSPALGGSSMPSGGAPPLTDDHLEAVELWIRGGAPKDLVVEGTADLLASCLPPPDPLIIPVPDPPGAGVGVQLQQTPWPLPSQFEDEICMFTYYDFSVTDLVPLSAQVNCEVTINNPTGKCFKFRKYVLAQDAQSHHSILRSYIGAFDTTHPGWGGWTYKFQDPNHDLNGLSCDPLAVDPNTGYHAGCSSEVQSQIACLGSGPPDLSQGALDPDVAFGSSSTAPSFAFSQETYISRDYADGVYNILPMQGILVWNSHAFNLTITDSTLSQYLNLFLADLNDLYPLQEIFEADSIFVANVPPFETREYCRTVTLPQGARLFELSSHTHQRGVLWRIWPPPNTPCLPGEPACVAGDPFAPIYVSANYTDPIQLIYETPVALDSPIDAERTYLYCSQYDNGSTPTSPPVKRRSTSPEPAFIFGQPLGPGGPCPDFSVACANEGPTKGNLCNGNDSVCDSSPGAGDGDCDACPVLGGVTTEDEMFIQTGAYYLELP